MSSGVTSRTKTGPRVRLYRDEMVVGLGSSGLISRTVRYGEIASLVSVRYDPLHDFGGWGVRGTAKRRIWSVRGNEAVVLSLADGRVFYVGSDHPRRLEERTVTIWRTTGAEPPRRICQDVHEKRPRSRPVPLATGGMARC